MLARQLSQCPRDIFEGRLGGKVQRNHAIFEDKPQTIIARLIDLHGLHETLRDLAVGSTAEVGEQSQRRRCNLPVDDAAAKGSEITYRLFAGDVVTETPLRTT